MTNRTAVRAGPALDDTVARRDYTGAAVLLLSFVAIPTLRFISIGAMLAFLLMIHHAINGTLGPSRRWIGWSAVAALSGATMALLHGPDQSLSRTACLQVVFWLLANTSLAVMIAKAAARRGLKSACALIGTSAIAEALLRGLPHQIDWKGGLGVGIALLLLSRVGSRRAAVIVACSVILACSIIFDSRSMAIMVCLAALIGLIPQALRAQLSRFHHTQVLLALLLIPVLLQVGSYALNAGYLGSAAQERTKVQTSHGESIILGGRTEWNATVQLMREQPLGYGAGVSPNETQYDSAIAAVGRAGGDIYSPYFSTVVFAKRVDLHSIAAGMWYHFGIPGLLESIAIALSLLAAFARSLATESVPALTFIVCEALWSVAFSPLGDAPMVAAGVGIIAAALVSHRPPVASGPRELPDIGQGYVGPQLEGPRASQGNHHNHPHRGFSPR